MATLKKRKGGTLAGFIAGLITGLVIAVVVALMVTKTPIPFAGRKDKPENVPVSSTVSAPASDPNQALYGKGDTNRPVFTDNSVNSPAEQTAAPLVQPLTPEDTSVCYLQAGAFRNKKEAENMRGNLALLGFESHISEASSNTGNIYRVRLGPYKGNTVNSVQNRLKQNGINTTVTRPVKQ